MKRILFPQTNRVHGARQKLLLDELRKEFEVDVQEYQTKATDIIGATTDVQAHFTKVLADNNYDLALIRADRFELLPIAMLCVYKGIPIAHLEGGDMSGAIDNKVRHAITALSDLHFATNSESYSRLIAMGTNPDYTHNFGSLDVEYAKSVGERDIPIDGPYILICHHPMPGEDPALTERIVREEFKGRVIVIKSNSDNGSPYGKEEFEPKEYIKLIVNAKCLVGNSSSFLKEASIFGTPVLNIGDRQKNRLKPHNVVDVVFNEDKIRRMLNVQLNSTYEPSYIYFKENTSKNIVEKIKEFLYERSL